MAKAQATTKLPPKQQEQQHTEQKNKIYQEKLDLSHRLRQLSNQKELHGCLALYRSPIYDNLRDSHHGSIVVDCCARCGNIAEAEVVINQMMCGKISERNRTKNDGVKQSENEPFIWDENMHICFKQVPIQAWTALLKGYVHCGFIGKADSLFNKLCIESNVISIPRNVGNMLTTKREREMRGKGVNVRTLNTLLRGCLWNATSINHFKRKPSSTNKKKRMRDTKNNSSNELVGGVVTVDRAWSLFVDNSYIDGDRGVYCDSSSYEYYVTLLCQSLQCKKARLRMEQMKKQFDLPHWDDLSNTCPAFMESLVICLVAISRAHALLGETDKSKEFSGKALDMIKQLNSPATVVEKSVAVAPSKRVTTGGKQAWTSRISNSESFDGRREESNKFFRAHRISELAAEAMFFSDLLPNYLTQKQSNSDLASLHQHLIHLAQIMLSKLFYFSGGGTTGLDIVFAVNEEAKSSRNDEDQSIQQRTLVQWYNSLWYSFGLKEVIGRLLSDDRKSIDLKRIFHSQTQDYHALTLKDCECLRMFVFGSDYNVIDINGLIDFSLVFSSFDENSRCNAPLHIELGAGSGDWASLQAQLNPSDNYVTVELRADRVAQSFSKALLSFGTRGKSDMIDIDNNKSSFLMNLCCVGSECSSFLRERVQPGTVRTIFVNHPEPPTQTCYSDDEKAHILNSRVILDSSKCLEPNGKGRLIIVTDNLMYAKLICRTMSKILDVCKLEALPRKDINDLRDVASFRDKDGHSCVHLYEGKPSQSLGHFIPKDGDIERGSSYFDRLWRTGAGKHAEITKRFIIAVQTKRGNGGNDKISYSTPLSEGDLISVSASGSIMHSSTISKKLNRKRSAEKQKLRNERRLLKKQQIDVNFNS